MRFEARADKTADKKLSSQRHASSRLYLPADLTRRSPATATIGMMAREYVECRENTFYIVGSRVPLKVIIHEYTGGVPAEGIAHCFPTLSLEQIHGALAFYHGNKTQIEKELGKTEEEWKEFRIAHPIPGALKARLEHAKEQPRERG